MGRLTTQPPEGAPEGTVWFGGPVDRIKVSLRIFSDEATLGHLTALLRCEPTRSRDRGSPYPPKSHWSLTIDSEESDVTDLDDAVRRLLAKLPADPGIWRQLHEKYSVDVFCGVFMETAHRGFGIAPDVSRLLAERNLEIGFDVYYDPPKTGVSPTPAGS